MRLARDNPTRGFLGSLHHSQRPRHHLNKNSRGKPREQLAAGQKLL
jgi:hypothetical protein